MNPPKIEKNWYRHRLIGCEIDLIYINGVFRYRFCSVNTMKVVLLPENLIVFNLAYQCEN